MEQTGPPPDDWVNVDELQRYSDVPASEKLKWLEEMNEFFNKYMPPESKRAWEELKRQGW